MRGSLSLICAVLSQRLHSQIISPAPMGITATTSTPAAAPAPTEEKDTSDGGFMYGLKPMNVSKGAYFLSRLLRLCLSRYNRCGVLVQRWYTCI
jgi:hypothetical protein